jgi:hypothetical protein
VLKLMVKHNLTGGAHREEDRLAPGGITRNEIFTHQRRTSWPWS